MSKLILNTFQNIKNNKIPVWFMRQAGRYLPEYKEIRNKNKNFIEFCLNINDATTVTIQPIDRFNLDAAIIFSDILLINYAAGQKVDFIEKEGPVLEEINEGKFLNTNSEEFLNKLKNVYEIIKNTKIKLKADKTLYGFAGAPWTLYVYLRNLKSPKKQLNLDHLKNDGKILDFLTHLIILHCKEQIKAGADIIQIFDSWAGLIPENEFKAICIGLNKQIKTELKKFSTSTPVIFFPKGIKSKINNFIETVKPDGISIDYETDLNNIQKRKDLVFQGGMNPDALFLEDDLMKKEAEKYLNFFDDCNYIFNLGHGISQFTKPEKVEELVKFVRSYR
ncbi:MAG: uroporphyrinogen decarboxylase [Pelagibacteraceae bacterium]